jgi:hypothetical protein
MSALSWDPAIRGDGQAVPGRLFWALRRANIPKKCTSACCLIDPEHMILLGVNLRGNLKVLYALCQFEGVGMSQAQKVCDKASIHAMCRVDDLNDMHLSKLEREGAIWY